MFHVCVCCCIYIYIIIYSKDKSDVLTIKHVVLIEIEESFSVEYTLRVVLTRRLELPSEEHERRYT